MKIENVSLKIKGAKGEVIDGGTYAEVYAPPLNVAGTGGNYIVEAELFINENYANIRKNTKGLGKLGSVRAAFEYQGGDIEKEAESALLKQMKESGMIDS